VIADFQSAERFNVFSQLGRSLGAYGLEIPRLFSTMFFE
jgi:hypothetical protein